MNDQERFERHRARFGKKRREDRLESLGAAIRVNHYDAMTLDDQWEEHLLDAMLYSMPFWRVERTWKE